ncbi:hypothetical protein [Eisenbergiella sp.]
MAARFLGNTPYAVSELEMQRIPGFHTKRRRVAASDADEGDVGFYKHYQIPFYEKDHYSRFQNWLKRKQSIDTGAWYAALYLLTADAALWKCAEKAVKPDFIDFTLISVCGADTDVYVLYHTAKDLYLGTRHVSLSELADKDLVNDKIFHIAAYAFLLCRYGAGMLFGEKEDINV